jgi:hypothetical protein
MSTQTNLPIPEPPKPQAVHTALGVCIEALASICGPCGGAATFRCLTRAQLGDCPETEIDGLRYALARLTRAYRSRGKNSAEKLSRITKAVGRLNKALNRPKIVSVKLGLDPLTFGEFYLVVSSSWDGVATSVGFTNRERPSDTVIYRDPIT